MAAPTHYPYAGDGIRLVGDDTPERQLDGWLQEYVFSTQFWSVYAEEFGYRDANDHNYNKEQILQGAVLPDVRAYTTDLADFRLLMAKLEELLQPTQLETLHQRVDHAQQSLPFAQIDLPGACEAIRDYLREIQVPLPLKAVTV